MRRASILLLFVCSAAGAPVQVEGPRPLTFDELVDLASSDPASPQVETRLDNLLSQPFVGSETDTDETPELRDPPGGKVLRVAEWNINREDNASMLAALSNLPEFEKLANENPRLRRKQRREAVQEARYLEDADVIVLNEVDKGVKRTGYRDVTRDLATALHMNYVFATEFIELTPIYLGLQKMDAPDLRRQSTAREKFGVDPKRYLGLEGTALLSRYPIRSARIVHLPSGYDWYKNEAGAISDIRKADRWTAERLFEERLRRQVRRGDRLMIVAELEVPVGKTKKPDIITVVCPHLEDYAPPKARREEMDFVLDQIKSISTPVVMAGDFNTMGHDGAPVTAKRLVRGYLLNYRFWARQVLYFFVPFPGLSYSVAGVNYLKNLHDPTATDIPILASNHDQPLFADLAKFRFEDGSGFLWAGTRRDSFRHRGSTLSVTNQRSWKGFEPTFQFARTYHGLVGEYKLDWILVKQNPGF
jgi:endonuclease/exonuclease/phosphatase family metal-dependent hydrolase